MIGRRFQIVVADPPWKFGDGLKMADAKTRGADSHYQTMTLNDICALPIESIVADSALLALWCPSAMILDGTGARVLDAWGFEGKQIWTWIKTTRNGRLSFGMGRLGRNCTEHALLATRGKPSDLYARMESRSERTAFLHPTTPHSVKPETLQDQIDRMLPPPPGLARDRLELFARRRRRGWITAGNECPGTEGKDIREWFAEQIRRSP